MSDPLPPSQLRVSDADRALVESRLRRAVEVGQLELAEFDQRARLSWAARTRGELDAVTRDLGELPPPDQPAPLGRPPTVPARADRADSPVLDRWFSGTGGGTAMKVLIVIWACAFAANLASWVAVGLGTGDMPYPWPVWQLPSGAILATLYALGIGRPHRR